eukprot:5499766-Amphidinium_carterae.3
MQWLSSILNASVVDRRRDGSPVVIRVHYDSHTSGGWLWSVHCHQARMLEQVLSYIVDSPTRWTLHQSPSLCSFI